MIKGLKGTDEREGQRRGNNGELLQFELGNVGWTEYSFWKSALQLIDTETQRCQIILFDRFQLVVTQY